MNTGRILAIDFGKKRLGLALSDSLRLTAQPYGVIQRKKANEIEPRVYDELDTIVSNESVSEIVVGLPKRLDGSHGDMALETKAFVKELRSKYLFRVRLWDERYSTHAAERSLLEGNVRRKKRKQVIDQTAAAWMLQGYLDAQPK